MFHTQDNVMTALSALMLLAVLAAVVLVADAYVLDPIREMLTALDVETKSTR